MAAVCVYCGSSEGSHPAYADAAGRLGTLLAGAGLTVVYGGDSIGLMGIVADSALAAGGEVVGIIPTWLTKPEKAHHGLSELVVVETMHERKMEMFRRSDAFVALPGGIGTLEELTEMTTWAQLGLHGKPVVTVDVLGYWTPLHRFFEQAVDQGFMKQKNLELITNVRSVDEVLAAIRL